MQTFTVIQVPFFSGSKTQFQRDVVIFSLGFLSLLLLGSIIGTVVFLKKRKQSRSVEPPPVKRHKPKPNIQSVAEKEEEKKDVPQGEYLNKKPEKPHLKIFEVLFRKHANDDADNINLDADEIQYENPSVYIDYANDVGSPEYQNS